MRTRPANQYRLAGFLLPDSLAVLIVRLAELVQASTQHWLDALREKGVPAPGGHTDDVFSEWLGYSDTQIEALKQSEVI